MKAVILKKFGSYENLKIYNKYPDLTIEENEILVKVRSFSINPIDLKTRSGGGIAAKINPPPLILGWDCSGVVKKVGSKVSKFKVGDEVIAMTFGSKGRCYAEYMVDTPESFALKPDNIDFYRAAGLPLAGLTALQALQKANIDVFNNKALENKSILVLGATGGTGHLVGQIAKILGAKEVIGTCYSVGLKEVTGDASMQEEILKDFKFDSFIYIDKYSKESLKNKKVDYIIDCIGQEIVYDFMGLVKDGGYFITLPTITKDAVLNQAKNYKINASYILVKRDQKGLERLVEMVKTKDLDIFLYDIFNFVEIAEAHKYMEETRKKVGKIVLGID